MTRPHVYQVSGPGFAPRLLAKGGFARVEKQSTVYPVQTFLVPARRKRGFSSAEVDRFRAPLFPSAATALVRQYITAKVSDLRRFTVPEPNPWRPQKLDFTESGFRQLRHQRR